MERFAFYLIRGTEGYQISDQGRVKNHKGRITEGHHKPNNYVVSIPIT